MKIMRIEDILGWLCLLLSIQGYCALYFGQEKMLHPILFFNGLAMGFFLTSIYKQYKRKQNGNEKNNDNKRD